MNFGEQQEEKVIKNREVFLGKKALKVIAVNPTEEWMKEKELYIFQDELVRHGIEVDKSDSSKSYNFAKVDIFLQDAEDVDSEILRVSYKIQKRGRLSNDGNKAQVINRYGSTLWVPIDEAKTMKISNPFIGKTEYVLDSARIAYFGEEGLISFIRAMRRLDPVKVTDSEEHRIKNMSMFEIRDLDKLLSGDFKDIINLITSSEGRVCFLLGARINDKGYANQDLYKDMPMPSWMEQSKNNDYLIKKVSDAQGAGMYKNTYFDLRDLSLKLYVQSKNNAAPTKEEDLFGTTATNEGFGTFEPAPFVVEGSNDDLPF